MNFSEEQKRVINERNSNILVSAAAGSGKTTVLVERIIQKLLDKDNPVDIDRILVLTFTNAAAAHMREKIEEAILKGIEADPGNEHLLKQESLIHNAHISTIDSFCLFILRNNFTKVSVDPGFRTADRGEVELIKGLVADRVIETLFDENIIEGFEDLADRFVRKNRLSDLKKILLKVYEQTESAPFFDDYVEERRNDYHIKDEHSLESTEWVKYLAWLIKTSLTEALSMAESLLDELVEYGGADAYIPAIEDDVRMLEVMCSHDKFWELQILLLESKYKDLGRKKSDSDDEQVKERAKAIRGEYKKIIDEAKNNYAYAVFSEIKEGVEENNRIANILWDVIVYFHRELQEEKRRRKIIDFTDMEHLALQILLEKKDGEYVPTKEAIDLRECFDEIMVDEYQDSNRVQEYLISTISGETEGRFNRFMVGDVKQSIYGFRNACPELFMEKYESYTQEKSDCVRIDLSSNYRSRKEVVDSVNYICEKLISKDLGGIDYTGDARLNWKAEYPDTTCNNKTEFLVLEHDEQIADNKKAGEAMMVALRINELIKHHQVKDAVTGAMRPCMYKDIVILLRSSNGWDEEFKKTLESQGIPTFVESKKGYFSSTEVRMLLNYLKAVDNPRNEIDLFGALVSPFGGFDDEEIARIRNVSDGNLIDVLRSIKEDVEVKCDKALKEKVSEFVTKLDMYRERVAYDQISKLVSDIIEESGFLFHVSAMPYGEQRKANILMLVQMAKSYESGSFKGLYHFIRYIEEMKNYDIDFGEASTLDEKSNVVRIVTMHKSKGLEFPVCFVCGTGKKFNTTDETDKIIFDKRLGMGLDYMDLKTGIKYSDIRCNLIKKAMHISMLAEELRVLYVALTRAQEKLIITASVSDMEKFNNKKNSLLERCAGSRVLPWTVRSKAATFLDYLMCCLDENAAKYIEYKEYIAEDIERQSFAEKITKKVRKENVYRGIQSLPEQNDRASEVLDRINFEYPHADLDGLYTKTSVSELKIAAIHDGLLKSEMEEVPKNFFEDHETNAYIPSFVSKDETIKGTTRGSAYHRVMELIDFESIDESSTYEDIKALIEKEINSGRIDRDFADLVDVNKIVEFFISDLGLRMCEAARRKQLYLEEPFVLGINADRLDKNFPDNESVLIQGIIDAFFIEGDNIILMDYKTDAVKTKEALVDRYKVQLDYYTEALERIHDMHVKERLIYSFALAKTIEV